MSQTFNLESAISAWRSSLDYNRTFTEDDLDELERHVRDHVKGLMATGETEATAFSQAVKEIGGRGLVEGEYEKVYWGKVKRTTGFSAELALRMSMFRNYWKVAVRSIGRYKSTALINITGLAIGIACCIVIMQFVKEETSYDAYHENKSRLYRVTLASVEMSSGESQETATSSILWGPALQRDYPEVESYTRFVKLASADNPWQLSYENHSFFEEHILYADPSVFELFSWPLVQGDPATALSEPRTIVLTERTAAKYFNKEDPIGKTITLDPRLRDGDGQLIGSTFEYTVSGVLKDIPRHSHFRFDFLLPSSGLNSIYGGDINTGTGLDSWFWRSRVAHTYLLLRAGASPAGLEAKFEDFLARYVGDDTRSRGYYFEPAFQRLDDIYLDGPKANQLAGVGSTTDIMMFSIISFFILCIACINFMNLSTARSSARAKEVGLRKVVGAHRSQLVTQFLGESILISLLACVFAVFLVWIIRPVFYGYLGRELAVDGSEFLPFLLSFLALGLLVGTAAGSYPAFFLTRFTPAQGLKRQSMSGTAGAFVRKGLIVFQFVITAFLIIATLTVFNQLEYMRSYNLGFDQERVVVLPPNVAQPLASRYDALRDALLKNPQIKDVTIASGVPGQGGGGDLYGRQGAPPDQSFGLGEIFVDYNYVSMFGIEMVAGRDFSTAFGADQPVTNENGWYTEVAVILNEEGVRRFGWSSPEEAIGQQIIRDPNAVDWTGKVVGVVKDFHFQDLRQPISAGALILVPEYSYVAVKLNPGNLTNSIAFIEETVSGFSADAGFEYTFLDEAFQRQYQAEQQLGEVFSYISFLAIFIACLGLFGLAAFTADQRVKEIGVRKVLGASMLDVVVLLSKGVTRLVLIAVVIALPLAYFATERWLEYFPYRIDFSPGTFFLSCVLAVFVAVLTISYQTIKAANADPVESLRYE